MRELIIGFEVALWLAGIVLLARLVIGKLPLPPVALAPWRVSIEGIVMNGLLVAAGAMILPQAATYLNADILGPAAHDSDWWQIVQGAAFQLGMITGALTGMIITRLATFSPPGNPAEAPSPPVTAHPLLAGVITFAITLPLLGGVSFGWKTALAALGLPADDQGMVDMFRSVDSPTLFIFMTILAVVIAPVTEELVFRAGLFRYLRTRIPRALAYLLPALFFAFLHVNWKTLEGLNSFVPLILFAVLFSYAYERTGRIIVPMIAHALFNLNTIVLIMAGVTG